MAGAALKDALNSKAGAVGKGALSFLFGPSALLAGLVVGVFTKMVVETTNAMLSQWVKNVSTGVQSLFANNPFLTWASSASSGLIDGSWNSFAFFYKKSLIGLAHSFEDLASHEGFGNTGVAGEMNDPRDVEAMAQGRGENPETAKRLKADEDKYFEMLKEFNKVDDRQAHQAVRDLEEWSHKAQKLMKKAEESKDEKKAQQVMEELFEDYAKAVERNPHLGALVDLFNQTSLVALGKIQSRIEKGEKVGPKEIAGIFEGLAENIPESLVHHPKGEVLGGKAPAPKFQAKL